MLAPFCVVIVALPALAESPNSILLKLKMMAAPAVLLSAKTRQQLLMMVALPAVLEPAKASESLLVIVALPAELLSTNSEHAVVDDRGAAGRAGAEERDAAEGGVEDRRVAGGARIAEFDHAGS